MRNNTLFGTVFLVVMSMTSFGQAGYIVSVDVDDIVAGIQSNQSFFPGATVTAGVFLELTAPSTLSSYNFTVRYDTTELSFVSRSESNFGILAELDTSNAVNTVTGNIFRIDGGTLGSQTSPFGPTRIATLVFIATNPSGGAGDIDITPGLFEAGQNAFFDGTGTNLSNSVVFNGASISAVPEPSSLWMTGAFVAVILGVWYVRRISPVAWN